jgi:peptidoglycan/LPS O-acetylase OafA/YrhL
LDNQLLKKQSSSISIQKSPTNIGGLRGVAVVLVIMFHAGTNLIAAGCVGLDAFLSPLASH